MTKIDQYKIPPYRWQQGKPPKDGEEYYTYTSPLGYAYYIKKEDVNDLQG